VKVLVTGATGFLGEHLVARLRADHDVVRLVRSEVAEGDVRGDVLDPESLRAALDGCDAVVHAAGAVSHKTADASRMYDVHVRGTENLLDAARSQGVGRVVYIGSSGAVAVSDRAGHVADETTPEPLAMVARWPYYRAKLFAEQAMLAVDDLHVVVLSPSLLLGPGDRRGGATRAVRFLLDGDLPAAPPGGICFVDVRDVAEAAAMALIDGKPGRRYLLGAANWSFAEFYERLARVAEVPAPKIRLPRATRRVLDFLPKLDPQRLSLGRLGSFGPVEREDLEFGCYWWWLDATRAREELGWTPRDPTETLVDTVQDLRAHR
jgi:dihydroflavonol-4-reductase